MLNMFETLSLSCNKKSKKYNYEWSTLQAGNGFDKLDDVFFFEVPATKAYTTKPDAQYCMFDEEDFKSHKLSVQRRDCKADDACTVKYKILKCLICKEQYEIQVTGTHTHDVEKKNNNLNGIHPKWKEVIKDLIEKGKREPKQIEIFLINNHSKYFPQYEVPSLGQIQAFVSTLTIPSKHSKNKVTNAAEVISKNAFTEENIKNPNKPFIFGMKYNSEDKVVIGNGSSECPMRICISSLSMLKKVDCSDQNDRGIFHIDDTYKITQNQFPLLVFGRSDIKRQFHPIAYMLHSHETTVDFEFFYTELKAILVKLGIKNSISSSYLMQDACTASVYPTTTLLMCWFHMKKRVEEKKHLVDESCREKIFTDLNRMHYSLNYDEYCIAYTRSLNRWDGWISDGKKGVKEFKDYMNKQWFFNQFCGWQIYITPPGYASTNNPIEQFNHDIKRSFTQWEKLYISDCLKEFLPKIVEFYSIRNITFRYTSVPSVDDRNEAKLMGKESFIQTTNGDCYVFNATEFKKQYYVWIGNIKQCGCSDYLDKMVCAHIVAALHYFKPLDQYVDEEEEFQIHKKKGRKCNKSKKGALLKDD
jgi:hypothetical protein